MRGSPVWQVVLVTVMFALAGIPVWRLTQPSAAVAVSDVNTPVLSTDSDRKAPQVVEVRADFAPPPRDFQIQCLGRTVLQGHGPTASFAARWSTTLPPEGVDLVVRAHWDAPGADGVVGTTQVPAGPSAARVMACFADGKRVEKSFWAAADGSLAEVFTVPASSPSP